ncbi:hypothetical protein NDU88_004482 [Pleurodeles waltl]|uniref:Uncharacterized protein n=1 Tax=Pleurodeles waltl TaxID=8319 RepID=A0AAV7VIF7_PLEWA|nr:hypothetical protein NDU88_004482 [Pleurodeles waltl]
MPPKRSVLCRPPRLLPHSMRLSRRYTEPALDGTQTPTDPAAQTPKEPGLGSIQTPTEPLALLRLCSVFASTPRHCLASPVRSPRSSQPASSLPAAPSCMKLSNLIT